MDIKLMYLQTFCQEMMGQIQLHKMVWQPDLDWNWKIQEIQSQHSYLFTLPYLTYPLRALLRIRPYGFRNRQCFTGKGYWSFAQPPTWRARCCNSSDLSPGTWPARLNLPGTAVPADIASRVTKARKPPHHDKVQHLGRSYLFTAAELLLKINRNCKKSQLVEGNHFAVYKMWWN